MTISTVKQKGLLLSTAGEAVEFELGSNRDETWRVTVYDQAGDPADITGYSGTFAVYENVQLTTALATGSIVLVTPASGIFSFSIGRDDFDTQFAAFDLGERLRTYLLQFVLIDASANEVEVADGTGAVLFPFRLRWNAP